MIAIVLLIYALAVVAWMVATVVAALRPGGELDRRASGPEVSDRAAPVCQDGPGSGASGVGNEPGTGAAPSGPGERRDDGD